LKIKLTYLYFLIFVSFGFAQNKQIVSYNLADGLPQSQVYAALQDNYGYLWLGTQGGGIARFDGDDFKVWNEKKGLISNYIHSLYYQNDSLFIGTRYGLTIKTKNVFANYKSPQINNIIFAKNNFLFATTYGCYHFNNDTQLSKLTINKQIDNSKINAILFVDNWYYMATNVGLFKVNYNFTKTEKLSNFDFKDVINYGDLIFAASYDKGIFLYDTNKDDLEIINDTKRINSLKILYGNEMWIATDNAGISIVNVENYKFIQKINKKNGLPILHVRKVISDKQANVWVATSGGLFKIFDNNFTHFDKKSGLKAKSVYAITKSKKGIYFTNADEGLLKIDSLGLHPITQDKGFLNVKARTIASDDFNDLYVGTDGKGVVILHNSVRDSIATHLDVNNLIVQDTVKVNYQFLDTLNTANGLASNWIKKIHLNNKVWVAHYSNGISSFNYNPFEREVSNLKNFVSFFISILKSI